MEQRNLTLAPTTKPRPKSRKTPRPSGETRKSKEELFKEELFKEEPLVHHYQGTTPHCAYYSIAILKGLDPKHVLRVAKETMRGTGLRSVNGDVIKLIRTYKALGYVWPYKEMKKTGTKTKDIPVSTFNGSGLIRLMRRKRAKTGHLVAFKKGIIYDPARHRPMRAARYLKSASSMSKKDRYFYMNVIPEELLDLVTR